MDPISDQIQPETRFELIGGAICLDFANTVGGVRGGSSQEHMRSYIDLVSWSQQSHIITRGEAETLLRKAESADAESVLKRAYALREAIYRIFAALAVGTQPARGDLDALNKELERGTVGAYVIATSDGFGWEWSREAGDLDSMLGPIARSAATLLTSVERNFVRQCAGASCGNYGRGA